MKPSGISLLRIFTQVSIEDIAKKLEISTYTAWKMRMKFLHAFEQLMQNTLLSDEIELDEKYFLNSHKGTQIDGAEGRKRGLSNEQICLPTAI